ncbi:HalOD1 output domain-containing protein [Halobaculum magnesiiphilum]|uniref:Halobacterial output domain-containing protein n=1 Tax=Halobaculum magnesiiphilum TaxID=1017351 RepID=A0A8T8WDB8_9EURY|nr:HalOD1 output domain-containing protein [Halobaculum magnesiiphilum]QZP37838.1 hypothetical protein K6T50_01270 [Halobaculum magnesiiphilum]
MTDSAGGGAVDVRNGVAVVDPVAIDENEATVIHAVVASVASVSGRNALELPPLYDVIDPEALTSLCSDRWSDGSDSSVRVSFEYADHLVTVSGCRTATATPLE